MEIPTSKSKWSYAVTLIWMTILGITGQIFCLADIANTLFARPRWPGWIKKEVTVMAIPYFLVLGCIIAGAWIVVLRALKERDSYHGILTESYGAKAIIYQLRELARCGQKILEETYKDKDAVEREMALTPWIDQVLHKIKAWTEEAQYAVNDLCNPAEISEFKHPDGDSQKNLTQWNQITPKAQELKARIELLERFSASRLKS